MVGAGLEERDTFRLSQNSSIFNFSFSFLFLKGIVYPKSYFLTGKDEKSLRFYLLAGQQVSFSQFGGFWQKP